MLVISGTNYECIDLIRYLSMPYEKRKITKNRNDLLPFSQEHLYAIGMTESRRLLQISLNENYIGKI